MNKCDHSQIITKNERKTNKQKRTDKKEKTHTLGSENFQNKHYGWCQSTHGFKKFSQACANNPKNNKWAFLVLWSFQTRSSLIVE